MMMKKIITLLCILAGITISCETEDTLGVSAVTNYPIITINGDKTVFVDASGSFTDLGAESKEGENVIETTTSTSKGTYFGKEISSMTPDKYTVSYSAVNEDGFTGSAGRTIWVYKDADLNTSLEGIYLSDVQRAPSFTPLAQYDDMEHVMIYKTSGDTYAISHGIGGYYDIGRGYGPSYAAKSGTITVNDMATNDYTMATCTIPGWGLAIDIQQFTVNPSDDTITYSDVGDFGNGTFKVQLKKVKF